MSETGTFVGSLPLVHRTAWVVVALLWTAVGLSEFSGGRPLFGAASVLVAALLAYPLVRAG